MDMLIFAKRLKAVREERNVSAIELAEVLGINKATIYRYEAAEIGKIKSVTINAIAEYLKINPDYLTGASDNKHTVKEAEDLVSSITDEEKMMIELFRQIPEEQQRAFLEMGRVFANSLKKD